MELIGKIVKSSKIVAYKFQLNNKQFVLDIQNSVAAVNKYGSTNCRIGRRGNSEFITGLNLNITKDVPNINEPITNQIPNDGQLTIDAAPQSTSQLNAQQNKAPKVNKAPNVKGTAKKEYEENPLTKYLEKYPLNPEQHKVYQDYSKHRMINNFEEYAETKDISDDYYYAGYTDTGFVGGGQCSLGHTLRYVHYAKQKETGEQIAFGIVCVRDFFELDKLKMSALTRGITRLNEDLTFIFVQKEQYPNFQDYKNEIVDLARDTVTMGITTAEDPNIQFINRFIRSELCLPYELKEYLIDLARVRDMLEGEQKLDKLIKQSPISNYLLNVMRMSRIGENEENPIYWSSIRRVLRRIKSDEELINSTYTVKGLLFSPETYEKLININNYYNQVPRNLLYGENVIVYVREATLPTESEYVDSELVDTLHSILQNTPTYKASISKLDSKTKITKWAKTMYTTLRKVTTKKNILETLGKYTEKDILGGTLSIKNGWRFSELYLEFLGANQMYLDYTQHLDIYAQAEKFIHENAPKELTENSHKFIKEVGAISTADLTKEQIEIEMASQLIGGYVLKYPTTGNRRPITVNPGLANTSLKILNESNGLNLTNTNAGKTDILDIDKYVADFRNGKLEYTSLYTPGGTTPASYGGATNRVQYIIPWGPHNEELSRNVKTRLETSRVLTIDKEIANIQKLKEANTLDIEVVPDAITKQAELDLTDPPYVEGLALIEEHGNSGQQKFAGNLTAYYKRHSRLTEKQITWITKALSDIKA